MEKKEIGWCEHVCASGFFKPTGGSALRIESDGTLFLYFPSGNVTVVCCEACYRSNNPKLTELN